VLVVNVFTLTATLVSVGVFLRRYKMLWYLPLQHNCAFC